MSTRCPVCGRVQGRSRSSHQNRYYHGVIVSLIAEETGNDPHVVHEALKKKFLDKEIAYLGKEQIEVPVSTTSLTTSQMEDYHTKCRIWAAEFLGIQIPLPHEPIS